MKGVNQTGDIKTIYEYKEYKNILRLLSKRLEELDCRLDKYDEIEILAHECNYLSEEIKDYEERNNLK